MLGANAILGEVIRIELPKLAEADPLDLKVPGHPWAEFPDDPLHAAAGQFSWLHDAPSESYKRGVLSRDGGHFQAIFAGQSRAEAFVANARDLLGRRLPSLRWEIRVESWLPDPADTTLDDAWKPLGRVETPDPSRSFFIDDARPCDLTGTGVAEETIKIGTNEFRVTREVFDQWSRGPLVRRGRTQDIVGALQRPGGETALPCTGEGWDPDGPMDLQSIAGAGQYLALVHVDGNDVGGQVKRTLEGCDRTPGKPGESAADAFQRWLSGEATIESMFHANRANLRAALVATLKEIFGACSPADFRGIAPYQLLMLGGDDLLIVTRASYAMRFVASLARQLDAAVCESPYPLSFGAGVAIARPSFPFHALHELAEELTASSKHLARGTLASGQSVVDWMVVSQSNATSVLANRRAHAIVRYATQGRMERLVTVGRPYPVLSKQGCPIPSLESLLAATSTIDGAAKSFARSQRKALPDALRRGRRSGVAAIEDLPTAARQVLIDAGLLATGTGRDPADPWVRLPGDGQDEANWISYLPDALELCEIPHLGRKAAGAEAPDLEPEVIE